MDIKLTKNDNGGYDAEVTASFELGDIDTKEVEERDGEITEIEGIRDEVDYNLTIEGDDK